MKPIFITGTGRCGTHLFYELFKSINGYNSQHIVDLDGDSFFRYMRWNGIEVDTAPLIHKRKQIIEASSSIYVESNPYLSFHINDLKQNFDAQFIFLIRNPKDVVMSHLNKGWYSQNPEVGNAELPLGFQYGMKTNHFLGRIIPRGEEYQRWIKLTRVGKLAWMWNKVNLMIDQQLLQIGNYESNLIRIEDLNFRKFQLLLDQLNHQTSISSIQFKRIFKSRPGKMKSNDPDLATWNDIELQEFEKETSEARIRFGY